MPQSLAYKRVRTSSAKLLETSKQFARRVIFIFRVKHVALAEPALGFQILGAINNRMYISLSILLYEPPHFWGAKAPSAPL